MNNLHLSQLFDEKSFYTAFIDDLECCEQEVIIESPYITSTRIRMFYPIFEKLLSKGVKIYVVTKNPDDLENQSLNHQSQVEIQNFECMGIQALLCIGNHHRKLAILDRKILWEGSLNIFSHAHSREIMRRVENKQVAMQMFDFLNYYRFI